MSSADNSRKASSFSNTSKQIKGNQRIKPLTRDFFTLLIKLEADFANKQYSVATLDELIQYYAKAVEYYDSIKDEISSYFIFKIQDILATKKSLKMLLEQNTKTGTRQHAENTEEHSGDSNSNKKVTFAESSPKKSKELKENIIEESSGEEDDGDKHVTALEKMRRAAKEVGRKNRISISTMKNEKQRFVNFFYKMETQKANEKQTMKAVMNDFGSSSDKNDVFVKKDVDNQKERLRKRLEKRKNENFMSHTMNTYSFNVGGTTGEGDGMFGSFLNDLNDAEGSGSKQLSNIEGSERLDTDGDTVDFLKHSPQDNPLKSLTGPAKFETPSFDDSDSHQKVNNPEAVKGAKIGGMATKSE